MGAQHNKCRQDSEETSVSYDLTWEIPDDILIEIFLRLPLMYIVWCMAVCKRWHSIIRRNWCFLGSLKSSVMFRLSDGHLHGLSPPPLNLDFLPKKPNKLEQSEFIIRACSTGDLLLVSNNEPANFLVCNPLTRQWSDLPNIPRIRRHGVEVQISPCGYGIVTDYHGECYRVAVLNGSQHSKDNFYFWAVVFESETRRWTRMMRLRMKKSFPSLRSREVLKFPLDPVATAFGTLYWLDGTSLHFRGVISFNPFTFERWFIDFPPHQSAIARLDRPARDMVRLGAVYGRLRLSRIFSFGSDRTKLKIWELNMNSRRWKELYNITLKKFKYLEEGENEGGLIFLLAMDPGDGNVVFVAFGRQIYRLKLRDRTYSRIGEIPEIVARENVASNLKVFTLAHSLFPTPEL